MPELLSYLNAAAAHPEFKADVLAYLQGGTPGGGALRWERSRPCVSSPPDGATSRPVTPPPRRASASIDACVIVAGCAIRLSTPPSDSASVKCRSADVNSSTASRPPQSA